MSAKRPKRTVPKKAAMATRAVKPTAGPAVTGSVLLPDLRELILTTRQTVARGVNAALTMLYWQIGVRIRRDILADQRAEYGKEIVPTLGRQLESEFGRGFGEKNLHRMVQFAEVFPDEQIVAALLRQLGWTHFTMLIRFSRPAVLPPPTGAAGAGRAEGI